MSGSEDLEGEDMELFDRFNRRASTTLNGRRARETRPLARADRQRISNRSIKNCQLNLKVTPEFRERVSALARNRRVSMCELVEIAVDTLADQQREV